MAALGGQLRCQTDAPDGTHHRRLAGCGFGHAYRAGEPQVSLCGVSLDGYHHWSEWFDIGSFERCQDCLAALSAL